MVFPSRKCFHSTERGTYTFLNNYLKGKDKRTPLCRREKSVFITCLKCFFFFNFSRKNCNLRKTVDVCSGDGLRIQSASESAPPGFAASSVQLVKDVYGDVIYTSTGATTCNDTAESNAQDGKCSFFKLKPHYIIFVFQPKNLCICS